jgi:hypothetical protein
MTFDASWSHLLEEVEDLPPDATLITPLSQRPFRITDVQEHRILVEYHDDDGTTPLQREQFEILFGRIQDARNGFDFDRLPPTAEPYATVLSLLPVITASTEDGILQESDVETASPFVFSRDKHPAEADEKGARPPSEPEVTRDDLGPTVTEMMENMGDPGDRTTCPVEGCQYSHRSAASVARHVSGSSTGKHIWANTEYAGWRDFVRQHR